MIRGLLQRLGTGLLLITMVGLVTAGRANAQAGGTPLDNQILQAVTNLQNNVNTLQTTVNTLQTTVNGLQTALTKLQTTVANLPTDQRKKYYMTKGSVPGNSPLAACDTGFHMASFWEIINPATLKYDTGRGQVAGDSGAGPVAGGALGPFAWVRTGAPVETINEAGTGNCNGWSSASSGDHGTTVNLQGIWDFSVFVSQIAPWVSHTPTCDHQNPVWCMED